MAEAYSKLTPSANTGLGFIDAVSDADILSWADPEDRDGDGISGIPNWVSMKDYLAPRPGTVEVEPVSSLGFHPIFETKPRKQRNLHTFMPYL